MSYVMDPSHRPLGLETDVANQNFSGARNPDDLLWVQFAVKPMQDNFATQAQGRPIFRDETWVEIRIPGRSDLTIERPMENQDKFRFPRQWNFFERTHSADGQNVGTPLSQWPLMRPSQIEELRALRFMTVEQIALSSDEALQRIGMSGGMNPLQLREKAKQYLNLARDSAVAAQEAEEKKAMADKLAATETRLAESEARHAAEMKEMRDLILATTRKPKGKPGRKPGYRPQPKVAAPADEPQEQPPPGD